MTNSPAPAGPEPRIIDRTPQRVMTVHRLLHMDALSEAADEIPGLIDWLGERGVEPAGAPFIKYNLIDPVGVLDVEAGVPVPAELTGDDRVLASVLPGGRFATVTHVGHPDGLYEATAALLDWGDERGVAWDLSETDGGQRWGLRMELYKTNPAVSPDPNTWETDLLFRLAD